MGHGIRRRSICLCLFFTLNHLIGKQTSSCNLQHGLHDGNGLFPRFQPVYPQSTFSMRSHVVTSSLKPNISKNQLSQGNIPKNTSKSSLLETFQGMIFQKKLHFYTLSRKSHPGATGFPPLLLPETCQTAPWHNGAKGFDENWRSYEVF